VTLSKLKAASGADRTPLPIRIADPADDAGWDELIRQCPGAHVFHSSEWAEVLRSSYGYQPCYFLSAAGHDFDGMLPFMEVRSWVTGRRGVSLPFSDECPALGEREEVFEALWDAAASHGRARGWKYVEIRCGRQFLPGAVPASTFFLHELGLSDDKEGLFAALDGAVRRAIRKAENSGIEIETAQSLDAVEVFYELQCRTRRRHGLPPQPFRFFRNIHKYLLMQDKGFLLLARHQDRPIAGAVFLHFGEQSIYKFAASDKRFQHLRANSLVLWRGIQSLAGKGCRVLSLGRTPISNEGLRRFKRAWGCRETSLDYVRYDLRRGRFISHCSSVSRLPNRVFRVMPGFISRLAGELLYPHAG
jgi:hypothetical protein